MNFKNMFVPGSSCQPDSFLPVSYPLSAALLSLNPCCMSSFVSAAAEIQEEAKEAA